jgi:hypothetical protein
MIYDGHEYSYSEDTRNDTGELKDNYGTVVAILDRDVPDEYYFAIDAETDDTVATVHQNVLKHTPAARGQWLLGCYVAHTTN